MSAVTWAWKIVYEIQDPVTSHDCKPEETPAWEVLAIGQPGVDYRDLVHNERYYIYREDKGFWTGHDFIGLIDQLVHFAHLVRAVRVGRDTLNSTMKKTVEDLGVEMRGK